MSKFKSAPTSEAAGAADTETTASAPTSEAAAGGTPHADEQGHITRAGMLAVVRAGGGVFVRDADGTRRIATTEAEIPSEEDFVKGNAAATARLRSSLQDQIAALKAAQARLGG